MIALGLRTHPEHDPPIAGKSACSVRCLESTCNRGFLVLIQRGYKTELRPTVEQANQLARHCGVARFAFNWALGRKIEHYQATGKTLTYKEVDAEFNRRKPEEWPWAYETSKWAHGNAIRDCEKAFDNFFRRLKQGGPPGFPHFRSKHRSTPKYRVAGEAVKVEDDRIRLPVIGWVLLKRCGYLPTSGVKLLSATVSQRAGRWFVSVNVEKTIVAPENQGPAVGLDVGLKSFVVGSDGSRLDPPKFFVRSLKKLRRLSRQHSRKQKGSANRRKSADKLAKLHFRIACQRGDFLHKASHHYASNFGLVCIEDLHIKGMVRNRHLARAISDAGWGTFGVQLAYKCPWYGGKLVEADRWYKSSKTCSVCGEEIGELPLSIREWTCHKCGTHHDRDENASNNLREYGRAAVTARTVVKARKPAENPAGETVTQEAFYGNSKL